MAKHCLKCCKILQNFNNFTQNRCHQKSVLNIGSEVAILLYFCTCVVTKWLKLLENYLNWWNILHRWNIPPFLHMHSEDTAVHWRCCQIIQISTLIITSTPVLENGDGRISTHANPTSTHRAISRTAHLYYK